MPENRSTTPKKRKSARPAKRLRITGVVRVMNLARQGFSHGVPPAELESFRSLIRDTVSAVETICVEHKITPQKLPAPTFRAYSYLKSLDLTDIPTTPSGSAGTPRQVRIRNVLSSVKEIQEDIERLAQKRGKGERLELLAKILSITNTIENSLAESKVTASQVVLSDPSRRAYQWMKYLSIPANLNQHITAVQTANRIANNPEIRKGLPALRRNLGIRVHFYHLPAVYRTRLSNRVIELTVNEGFVVAPAEVIRELIQSVLWGKQGTSIEKVKAFAAGEVFQITSRALDSSFIRPEDLGGGHIYHLGEIFDRLNSDYFHGKLERPRLTWSKTIMHRKLGHYQPSTDTVMINQLLDRPKVPDYAVDFVVYHELLHKQLKMSLVKGRMHAHTRAFREAEKRFKHYEAAQAYLQQIGLQESL